MDKDNIRDVTNRIRRAVNLRKGVRSYRNVSAKWVREVLLKYPPLITLARTAEFRSRTEKGDVATEFENISIASQYDFKAELKVKKGDQVVPIRMVSKPSHNLPTIGMNDELVFEKLGNTTQLMPEAFDIFRITTLLLTETDYIIVAWTRNAQLAGMMLSTPDGSHTLDISVGTLD